MPLRADGTPYKGVNALILWSATAENGFNSPFWLTYRKAQELGGQVNKGEKGTTVVYYKTVTKADIDEEGEETTSVIPFAREYTVFNAQQVSGLPASFYPASPSAIVGEMRPRLEIVEQFVAKTRAVIQHGGNQPYYIPVLDKIQMTVPQAFRDMESYYATLAHELIHWTGHSSRLDRNLERQRFGDVNYAKEELLAEIGAAFLCAGLGITPEVREDHAAYIDSWLKVLRQDRRAIFKAASGAQRAINYLQELTSPEPSA